MSRLSSWGTKKPRLTPELNLYGHNLSGYVRRMEPAIDILDAIDSSALRKRGTLRSWMVEHREAFAQRLDTRRPDWAVLAEVFVKAGLLDSRGNPPTAEATRKTWYRIKSDLSDAKSRPNQPKSGLSSSPGTSQAGPGRHTPSTTVDDIREQLRSTGRAIPKPIHE